MTHATHRECVEKGVGEVLDHTITEEGEINFYTIKWANGTIDRDLPKEMIVEKKSRKH